MPRRPRPVRRSRRPPLRARAPPIATTTEPTHAGPRRERATWTTAIQSPTASAARRSAATTRARSGTPRIQPGRSDGASRPTWRGDVGGRLSRVLSAEPHDRTARALAARAVCRSGGGPAFRLQRQRDKGDLCRRCCAAARGGRSRRAALSRGPSRSVRVSAGARGPRRRPRGRSRSFGVAVDCRRPRFGLPPAGIPPDATPAASSLVRARASTQGRHHPHRGGRVSVLSGCTDEARPVLPGLRSSAGPGRRHDTGHGNDGPRIAHARRASLSPHLERPQSGGV